MFVRKLDLDETHLWHTFENFFLCNVKGILYRGRENSGVRRTCIFYKLVTNAILCFLSIKQI